MNNLSKNEIVKLSKTELSQSQINSFKFGNTPNEEARLHSAIIKAHEISKISNYMDGKNAVEIAMVQRVMEFNSLADLEKSNELLLTGQNL